MNDNYDDADPLGLDPSSDAYITDPIERAQLAKRCVVAKVRFAVHVARFGEGAAEDAVRDPLADEILRDHYDPLLLALLRNPIDPILHDLLRDKVNALLRRDEEQAQEQARRDEDWWDYDGLGIIHPADR